MIYNGLVHICDIYKNKKKTNVVIKKKNPYIYEYVLVKKLNLKKKDI